MALAPLPIAMLAAFTAAVACTALFALTAAGHFPESGRLAHMKTRLGTVVLWGTVLLTGAAVALALSAAWMAIPLAWAVISASLAVLLAPLVLPAFPDDVVDGPRGLVLFATGAIVFAVLAHGLAR